MSTHKNQPKDRLPDFQQKDAAFVEALRALFDADPAQVPIEWHAFLGALDKEELAPRPSWAPLSSEEVGQDEAKKSAQKDAETIAEKGSRSTSIINVLHDTLREKGFRFADLNPLKAAPSLPQELSEKVQILDGALRAEWQRLKSVYTGPLALEIPLGVSDAARSFLYQGLEAPQAYQPTTAQRQDCLDHFLRAHLFETFLGKQFQGLKRFSIEGAEVLLPALQMLAAKAAQQQIAHFVMGMAHRGRLTLKALLFDTPLIALLRIVKGSDCFEGDAVPVSKRAGFSDVPYHLGATCTKTFETKASPLHMTLLPNPSHLESINPVVMGYAKAEAQFAKTNVPPLSVLVHGDAAFAGQGVVAESLLLGRLNHYSIGGTLHVILDNQVGFTASPHETADNHATGPAHSVAAPILHVNGQDADAVLRAFALAFDFRQKFAKDIVIRLLCYRRHGHNEMDEPRFTNPALYRRIDALPPAYKVYAQTLQGQGLVDDTWLDQKKARFQQTLQSAFEAPKAPKDLLASPWSVPKTPSGPKPPSKKALLALGKKLVAHPQNFDLHAKVKRFIAARAAMLKKGDALDFSTAEALAFASLLDEGAALRLAGQDSARGTFTQRHGVWVDQTTEARYTPFSAFAQTPQYFQLLNTPLSEAACLGFEIGYSWRTHHGLGGKDSAFKALTLWEAQFGDFANGAQIQIDQYLASSRAKWGLSSNITLLLPHGYEGQGPEHSSARLERFLQLAAQNNLRVAMPAKPASLFHLLRRQVYEAPFCPLVLLTPKSLLRLPSATSPVDALEADFDPLVVAASDSKKPKPQKPKRLVLCAGKVFYDLVAFYQQAKKQNPATEEALIVAIEQLYPFPEKALLERLRAYATPQAALLWAQEEPRNMGAMSFVWPLLQAIAQKLGVKGPFYGGRDKAASPATGFFACHTKEMHAMMQQIFQKNL